MPLIEDSGSGSIARNGKSSSFELLFHLKGYPTTSLALLAMTTAPTSVIPESVSVDGFSLKRRDYRVNPRGRGDDLHAGTVTYTHEESQQNTSQNPVLQNPGDIESTIDFGVQPIFTRRAKNSVEKGSQCPSVNNTIGYNPKGLPKGTQVDSPVVQLSYTKLEESATVTDAWITAREALLGQVNNATFKGRAAQTCQFNRMQLRTRAKDGQVHVTYNFRHRPTGTLDLSTLDIGEAGNLTIYPFRIYEDIYKEEPSAGNGSNRYMTKKLIGLVEHELNEIQPKDFSIFGL